jgi:hypothetical protein
VGCGPQDLADYADTLSQGQLCAPASCLNAGRRVRCSHMTTFTRFAAGADGDRLEQGRVRWQAHVLSPTQDRLVMIDEKKARRGGGRRSSMRSTRPDAF